MYPSPIAQRSSRLQLRLPWKNGSQPMNRRVLWRIIFIMFTWLIYNFVRIFGLKFPSTHLLSLNRWISYEFFNQGMTNFFYDEYYEPYHNAIRQMDKRGQVSEKLTRALTAFANRIYPKHIIRRWFCSLDFGLWLCRYPHSMLLY